LPKSITSGFSAVAPVAGSGTVTDLSLGSASDTLSSPFIDYVNDYAYVGNDAGVIFRIKNVFCMLSTCTPGTSAAPVLDATWGTGGALAIGGTCTGLLASPVVAGTGNIFVGCADGKLYGFTSAGVALSQSPLTVGDGTALGGIVDPAHVDVVHGFVYTETMSSSVSLGAGAGIPVVVQASATDLSSPVAATLGTGAAFNLHAPAFNHAYLTGAANPLIYEVAGNTAGGKITLFGIAVNSSTHVMTSGAPAQFDDFTIGSFEISPLTEFYDGTEDRVFESTVGPGAGSLASFNVNNFPGGGENFASTGTGTTGIVVDNDATSTGQADSIYFGVLTTNTAEKLTQGGFQ
jgi:hypothetical protein